MTRKFGFQKKKLGGAKSGARVAAKARGHSKFLEISIYEDQMHRMGWKKGDLIAWDFDRESSAVVIGLTKTEDEEIGYKLVSSSGENGGGSAQISPTSNIFPMEVGTVMIVPPKSCEKEDEQLVLVLKTDP